MKQPKQPAAEVSLEYLKQIPEEYTSLSLVKLPDGLWTFRQTDIKNGSVIQVIDSAPTQRDICTEYFKMAAVDQFTRSY